MKVFLLFIIFYTFTFILGCTEKTTISGKIINDDQLTNLNISSKNQMINKLGRPSFVDEIQNKFFYYTEKKKTKNFYNKNTEYSFLFVFEFDKNDLLINSKSINLLEQDISKYQKKETENRIIERGLIEKVFGGVGPSTMPNSP